MRLKQYCKLSPWKKSLELDGLAARFYQAFTDEPTSISLKQPALPWYPNHIRLPQWARCEAVEVMFELQWTHPSRDDDRSMSCLSKTAVRTQGSWTNRLVMCFRKLDHRDKITKMIGAWKNPRLALATQHRTIYRLWYFSCVALVMVWCNFSLLCFFLPFEMQIFSLPLFY